MDTASFTLVGTIQSVEVYGICRAKYPMGVDDELLFAEGKRKTKDER